MYTGQLSTEQEKVRVLEESLHVLAREHHELEVSVASHFPAISQEKLSTSVEKPVFYDSDDDEFHDAFDLGKK